MAVSKNNPNVRDYQRLVVFCPECNGEMTLIKRVPGGMFYVCNKDGYATPVAKGCYKNYRHDWVRK